MVVATWAPCRACARRFWCGFWIGVSHTVCSWWLGPHAVQAQQIFGSWAVRKSTKDQHVEPRSKAKIRASSQKKPKKTTAPKLDLSPHALHVHPLLPEGSTRIVWTYGSPIHSNGSVVAAEGGTVELIFQVPQVPNSAKPHGLPAALLYPPRAAVHRCVSEH